MQRQSAVGSASGRKRVGKFAKEPAAALGRQGDAGGSTAITSVDDATSRISFHRKACSFRRPTRHGIHGQEVPRQVRVAPSVRSVADVTT